MTDEILQTAANAAGSATASAVDDMRAEIGNGEKYTMTLWQRIKWHVIAAVSGFGLGVLTGWVV